jgi:hypothetical protein
VRVLAFVSLKLATPNNIRSLLNIDAELKCEFHDDWVILLVGDSKLGTITGRAQVIESVVANRSRHGKEIFVHKISGHVDCLMNISK